MYLAIDIGGSKTLVATFTPDGTLENSVKFKTPHVYPDFIAELSATINSLPQQTYTAAGVAMPGKVDRSQGIGIAFGNLPWENVPLKADIEAIVSCPVQIENDANLAGLSEARLLPEYTRALYITVSTGIGGVIISNGSIDPGTQDAEIGHILLEHDGKLMRWEEFASGRAMYAKYGKKASEIPQEDTSTWYVISRNIAVGLIDVIAMLTPEVIIVGGGVGTHLPKFHDRLVEELKIYENPMLTIPPIVQAQRPEEAVIYGCFELVKED
jgi:predicted NBD/HSP70 family sugar kinase